MRQVFLRQNKSGEAAPTIEGRSFLFFIFWENLIPQQRPRPPPVCLCLENMTFHYRIKNQETCWILRSHPHPLDPIKHIKPSSFDCSYSHMPKYQWPLVTYKAFTFKYILDEHSECLAYPFHYNYMCTLTCNFVCCMLLLLDIFLTLPGCCQGEPISESGKRKQIAKVMSLLLAPMIFLLMISSYFVAETVFINRNTEVVCILFLINGAHQAG